MSYSCGHLSLAHILPTSHPSGNSSTVPSGSKMTFEAKYPIKPNIIIHPLQKSKHQTPSYIHLFRQRRQRNFNISIRSIGLCRQSHRIIPRLNSANRFPNIQPLRPLHALHASTNSHLNLPLLLLNILPQLPPPIPILPNPIRQSLGLQHSKQRSKRRVRGPENGNQNMRRIPCPESSDGCTDDNLQEHSGGHAEVAEYVLPASGTLT
jgi:hypothetical protein